MTAINIKQNSSSIQTQLNNVNLEQLDIATSNELPITVSNSNITLQQDNKARTNNNNNSFTINNVSINSLNNN